MSSFLDRPVAMATLAAGFIRFLSFLFPVVATPLFTGHVGSYDFDFTTAQPLAALVVIVVTGVNYFSVRLSGGIKFCSRLSRLARSSPSLWAAFSSVRSTPSNSHRPHRLE